MPAPTHPNKKPLALECLEGRDVPAGLFVAGVGGVTQAADPEITVYNTATGGAARLQIEAFGGTAGDTRVALGDVNRDGTDDIIAAEGKGGAARVAIFDGAQALAGRAAEIARFTAYTGFAGGVFVASADLNGDGAAEVVTTPGQGGRGHLKVFDFRGAGGAFLGSSPTLVTSAYTFTDYNGEVRVATMRVGPWSLVVTASGAGVPGDVRAYRDAGSIGSLADGVPVPGSFLAARIVPFGGYTGGLSLAAGDTNGNGSDELYLAKNGGAPDVEAYNAALTAPGVGGLNLFATFATFPGYQGEVRLGSADVDADGKVEVLTTTGFSGDPKGTPVKAFARTGDTFAEVRSFYANPGYQPGAWLAGKDFTQPGAAGAAGAAGTQSEDANWVSYTPAGIAAGDRRPIVFLFDPGRNPHAYDTVIRPVADRHKWIIATSKYYSNSTPGSRPDMDLTMSFNGSQFTTLGSGYTNFQNQINDALRKLPADPNRIIFGGTSGGASMAHALNLWRGGVAALLINVGMIWGDTAPGPFDPTQGTNGHFWNRYADQNVGFLRNRFQNSGSPLLAAFMGSSTDFRREEMADDATRLRNMGWSVNQLSFVGGHTYAPPATWAQAADWITRTAGW